MKNIQPHILSIVLVSLGLCLMAPSLASQHKKEPVIVGMNLSGKKLLVQVNGDELTATLDGEKIPGSQIEENGNVVTIKDEDGNRVARIYRWNGGAQIQTVARSEKAAIGVELDSLPKGLADHLELDTDEVVYVVRAIEGRAAAKAGLRDHDIVVDIDGRSPVNEPALREILAKKKPGDEIKVRVLRRGKDMRFTIRCERAKSDGTQFFGRFPGNFDFTNVDDLFVQSKALKAASKALEDIEKSDKTGEYKKHFEKAKKELEKARTQTWVTSPKSAPNPFFGTTDVGRWLRAPKQGGSDMVFLDPYLDSRTRTDKTLSNRLSGIEKRLERIERMLEKYLAKKSN